MKRYEAENRIADVIQTAVAEALDAERSIRWIGQLEPTTSRPRHHAATVLKAYFPVGVFEDDPKE